MFSSEMMRLNCLIKVYYVHHLQDATSSPDLKRIDMNVGLSVFSSCLECLLVLSESTILSVWTQLNTLYF